MTIPPTPPPSGSRPRARARGFTLIELMVVIVILGLLIGLVVKNPFRALRRGENDTALMQMKNIGAAIDLYRMENHSVPKALQDLTQADTRTKEPFMESIPSDPWGQPYEYHVTDDRRGKYEISSSGEDKQQGTDDDIYFPERDTGGK